MRRKIVLDQRKKPEKENKNIDYQEQEKNY